MTPCEQRTFATLKRLHGIDRPVMAEVGVGRCTMAKGLLGHPTLRLHLIDNWLPKDQQPQAYIDTGDFYASRTAEHCEIHYQKAKALADKHSDRVTIHRADSVEVARDFADGSLDLVFLDADHSYPGIKRDIAAWLPKVRRGGWLGGHDYHNSGDPRHHFEGVDRAVDEFRSNLGMKIEEDLNFTWWVRR